MLAEEWSAAGGGAGDSGEADWVVDVALGADLGVVDGHDGVARGEMLVRAMGVFNPEVRSVAGQLGERVELSSEKARTRLGWSPRPVEETIVGHAFTVFRCAATGRRRMRCQVNRRFAMRAGLARCVFAW